MAIQLILIRHATSTKNISDRIGTSTKHYMLTEDGLADSNNLAKILFANTKFDAIFCSNSAAPNTTANLIANSYNMGAIILPDLGAIDLGIVSGYSLEEIEREYPDIFIQLKAYMENRLHPRDLHIPEFETTDYFEVRILNSIKKIVKQGSRKVCIVAHRSTITMAINICENLPVPVSKGNYRFLDIPPLSLSFVEIENSLKSAHVHIVGVSDKSPDLIELLQKYQ